MPTTLITTTAGNSLLNGDSRVYMRISGGTYVREKARNLKRGDMVVYEKQYVDKELGEVEDFLMSEDPRYVQVKGSLFELNGGGIYVPRLRTGIWRGAPQEITGYPDFAGRVIREGNSDFEPDDYRMMAGIVEEALEIDHQNGGPEPVTSSAVRGWLTDTVAPADWRMFRALMRINPDFNQFYGDFMNTGDIPSLENIFDAYRLFVGIRRGIMNYIAARKGAGNGGRPRNGGDERTPTPQHTSRYSLQPEIDIIMRHVMQDVDDQRIVVAVTDVKNTPGQYSGPRASPQQKLTSGVVTGRENQPDNIAVKKWNEMINDFSAVCCAINDAMTNYIQKRCEENGVVDRNEINYVLVTAEKQLAKFTHQNTRRPTKGKLRDLMTQDFSGAMVDETKSALDIFAYGIYKEIVQGPSIVSDPEKRYHLHSLMGFLADFQQRIPPEWSEWNDLDDRLRIENPKGGPRKTIEERMKTLRNRIIGEYGFDIEILPNKIPLRSLRSNADQDFFLEFGRLPDPLERAEKIKAWRAKGIVNFTPEEEAEIIRQYGHDDLLDLSWIQASREPI